MDDDDNSTVPELELLDSPKLTLLQDLIRDCYSKNGTHSSISFPEKYNYSSGWCEKTFDGFACWDETPSGATAYQLCPAFIVGFDPQRRAYKSCNENGTWSVHPEILKPWTNYTSCVDYDDLTFRILVNNIYVIGYSLSLVALLLSLLIFSYFRALHCIRIRIHMHLFSSFTLNNLLWIVWYKAVVTAVTVVQDNEMWCQMLHVITQYSMVTSYFWMFCEGLHLHLALVVVFVKDHVAMRWFVGIGWGLSFVDVIIYALARYFTEPTERCWMDQTDTFWIIITPVVMSLCASFGTKTAIWFRLPKDKQSLAFIFMPYYFSLLYSGTKLATYSLPAHPPVFLINVVRVLLTKLHPAPNQSATVAAKKATRGAMILIPLFGLQFLLIPLRPAQGTTGEKVYQIVSALLTSLQGLCVSILFCFTNHDVVVAAKAQLMRFRMRRTEGLPMTGLTGGESVVNTRDNVV